MMVKKYPKVERPKWSAEFIKELKDKGLYHEFGKCMECGGEVEQREDLIYRIFIDGKDIVICGLKGSKCIKCGDTTYTVDSYDRIYKVVNQMRSEVPSKHYYSSISMHGNLPVIILKKDFIKSIY
ncbi:MAG: hypothetical protein ACE5KT_04410 [Methanosarcinales archaeon]